MSEIIEKTYNFIDTLDKSTIITNITKYKNNLMNNKNILKEIALVRNENNPDIKISKKRELYNNYDYKMYMKYYNELSYLVLKINQKYKEYTNTKEHYHE